MEVNSIKFLKENSKKNLNDSDWGEDFLKRTHRNKAHIIKEKNDKLEFNEIKILALLRKKKASQILGKSIMHISNKVPVSGIFKAFLKWNNKTNISKYG